MVKTCIVRYQGQVLQVLWAEKGQTNSRLVLHLIKNRTKVITVRGDANDQLDEIADSLVSDGTTGVIRIPD